MSWINTDSRQACEIAVLADSQFAPDDAAAVLFQHQRDFNYLELRHLSKDATLDSAGLHLTGMTYKAVIVDGLSSVPAPAAGVLARLAAEGRLIAWQTNRLKGIAQLATGPGDLVSRIDRQHPLAETSATGTTKTKFRQIAWDYRDYRRN